MEPKDIVIVEGARTAWTEWSGGKRGDGKPGGALAAVRAEELGATAIKGVLARTGQDPAAVDHVIMGYALQTNSQSIYGARHAGLIAGIPQEVPMLTLSRICGSGIQSIVSGAQMIMTGDEEVIVAGGMENQSQAPHVLRGARNGMRLGQQPQLEDYLFTNLQDLNCGLFMAQTSDELCRRKGITREQCDEFAVMSHQRIQASIDGGLFLEHEIVPVTVTTRKGEHLVTEEDHVVPDSTIESLAGLRPAFGKDGMATAGNASGLVDGAAAVLVKSASRAEADGDDPLARIVSWGIVGLEPAIMAYGPVPSSEKALARANLTMADIDRWEINEAFSGQAVACIQDLGLDLDKVNVNGGSVGLGHPLAATGTRLVHTLALELRRSGGRYGVATACIGGGQGIAMVIEAISA